MDSQLLEINLISAQNLKPPPALLRLHSYAVAWVDPAFKLRTRIDRVGGRNPTWNDKFIFRVPPSFLSSDDSPSAALSVEIFADGAWCLRDPLVGSVRLLLSNHHLSDRPKDLPSFAAVGIRRPSGRFHGVLNVGLTVLARVSVRAAEALAESPAIGYRELMGEGSRFLGRGGRIVNSGKDSALKELNEEVREEEASEGGGKLCGLGFQRRIHLSPSDQELRISWSDEKGSG